MKYLIVVLVIVVVGWLLLRERKPKAPAARAGPLPQALEVVACRHCGLHLPRIDCVEDRSGVYCSEAHRRVGQHPP
jgi:uncharacterized protein